MRRMTMGNGMAAENRMREKAKMTGKKWLAVSAAAVLAFGAFTACGQESDMGRDAALETALKDAGVSESDATRLKVSEDREDGKKIYEIRFDVAEKEYDYEIQASDGKILQADVETKQSAQNQTTSDGAGAGTGDDAQGQGNNSASGGSSNGTTVNSGGVNQPAVGISREQAAAIALERVPGATENDLKIELDYDDGQYRYEGDIIYQQREYEFEIDANTGTILEWSEERR